MEDGASFWWAPKMYVYVANEEREKHFDVISNSKNTKSKNRQQQQQQ